MRAKGRIVVVMFGPDPTPVRLSLRAFLRGEPGPDIVRLLRAAWWERLTVRALAGESASHFAGAFPVGGGAQPLVLIRVRRALPGEVVLGVGDLLRLNAEGGR